MTETTAAHRSLQPPPRARAWATASASSASQQG